MPAASDLIYTFLANVHANQRAAAKLWQLPQVEVSPLRISLEQDARGSLAKACLTLSDAVGALDRNAYSWAAVKLYYSCFYSTKAWLAASDECHLFLDRRSPAYIFARPLATIDIGSGTSHQFAFARFANRFASLAILSQDIGLERPFDWLRLRRDYIQYGSQEFKDPEVPEYFSAWVDSNPRKTLAFYKDVPETAAEYATLFDERHAMVAIPVRLLIDTITRVSKQMDFGFSKDQLRQVRRLCRIGGHPVSILCDAMGK